MKLKIVALLLFLFTNSFLSQAQVAAEFRIENEILVSPTIYEFDVYVYNTGTTTFELKAGTIAILTSNTWRNSGTITPSRITTTSELSTANQTGAISYVSGTISYFRQVIGAAGTTLGTSIASGARVRCGRFRLTNSVSYSSTNPPDFAWRYNASPFAGISYDLSGASVILISNTINPTNARVNTYRSQLGWTTGSNMALASSTVAPNSNATDIIFYNGSLSNTSFTCRSLNLSVGSSFVIGNGNSLNCSGSITNNGTLNGTGANLFLNGTGTGKNQVVSGNDSLNFNSIQAGEVGITSTKTINCPLLIANNLKILGTTTFTNNSNITLLSRSTLTAGLLEIPSGSILNGTGNFTIQRFIPGSSGRNFRYLSAPFVSGPNVSASWQQQIYITGTGTGGTTCPNLTANSNGFDATTTNVASMFTFNETSSSNPNSINLLGGSNFTNAWLSIPNTTSTSLTSGTGYRVFVRGSRNTGCTQLTGSPSANDVILSATGSIKTGLANIPLTYNASNGQGWNLVGNPFPSAIDWNASSGWVKTNIENSYWLFRPGGNHFSTFNGALGEGTNFATNIIESGSAFFVKAISSSPVLQANESVKANSLTGIAMFKSGPKVLRVTFVKPGELQDECIVAMAPLALNGNDVMDSEKMSNPSFNIYAIDPFGKRNAINTFLAAQGQFTVPLGVSTSFTGTHRLSFKNEKDFMAYDVLLEDKYLGVINMVNDRPTYTFDINANPATTGENRFSLIFVNRGDFDYLKRLEAIYKNAKQVLNIYPNPANSSSTIQTPNLNGAFALVKLYNSIGQELESYQAPIEKGNMSLEVNLENKKSGVYFVSVIDELGKEVKGKLIKQ